MTKEPRETRNFALLIVGAILVFGAPYIILVLNRARLASAITGLLPAVLILVAGIIMIYFSGKRVEMGD